MPKRKRKKSKLKIKPVYFNGYDVYETDELNQAAPAYAAFIMLVNQQEIDKIGTLNKKLGIRNARQLFEGNFADYGWRDYARFSATLIADNLPKTKQEEE